MHYLTDLLPFLLYPPHHLHIILHPPLSQAIPFSFFLLILLASPHSHHFLPFSPQPLHHLLPYPLFILHHYPYPLFFFFLSLLLLPPSSQAPLPTLYVE